MQRNVLQRNVRAFSDIFETSHVPRLSISNYVDTSAATSAEKYDSRDLGEQLL